MKFEYTILKMDEKYFYFNNKEFNRSEIGMDLFNFLGDEGWELVSVSENIHTVYPILSSQKIETKDKEYLFKREKKIENSDRFKYLKSIIFDEKFILNKFDLFEYFQEKIQDKSINIIIEKDSLFMKKEYFYSKKDGLINKKIIDIKLEKIVNIFIIDKNKLEVEFIKRYSNLENVSKSVSFYKNNEDLDKLLLDTENFLNQ